MQVPGGWAAQKYGGRATLIVAFALWSTGSLLTPRSARSTRGITAARVLVGIAQGGIIPSIHTVLSQASPFSGLQPTLLAFCTSGLGPKEPLYRLFGVSHLCAQGCSKLVFNVPPFLSAPWGFDEARSVTRPPDALK